MELYAAEMMAYVIRTRLEQKRKMGIGCAYELDLGLETDQKFAQSFVDATIQSGPVSRKRQKKKYNQKKW